MQCARQAGARRAKYWKIGGGEGGVAEFVSCSCCCVPEFHPALAELVTLSQLSKSILGFPGARREEGAPGSPTQQLLTQGLHSEST